MISLLCQYPRGVEKSGARLGGFRRFFLTIAENEADRMSASSGAAIVDCSHHPNHCDPRTPLLSELQSRQMAALATRPAAALPLGSVPTSEASVLPNRFGLWQQLCDSILSGAQKNDNRRATLTPAELELLHITGEDFKLLDAIDSDLFGQSTLYEDLVKGRVFDSRASDVDAKGFAGIAGKLEKAFVLALLVRMEKLEALGGKTRRLALLKLSLLTEALLSEMEEASLRRNESVITEKKTQTLLGGYLEAPSEPESNNMEVHTRILEAPSEGESQNGDSVYTPLSRHGKKAYKTKMCAYGCYCWYGRGKCRFAHSEEELVRP